MSDTVTISKSLFDKMSAAIELRQPALEIGMRIGSPSRIILTQSEYNELMNEGLGDGAVAGTTTGQ